MFELQAPSLQRCARGGGRCSRSLQAGSDAFDNIITALLHIHLPTGVHAQ